MLHRRRLLGRPRCASCATRRARSSPIVARRGARPRSATVGYALHAVPARRRRTRQLRLLVAQTSPRSSSTRCIALPGLRPRAPLAARRALPEDPRRRRRRAYTTGGLSPAAAARDARSSDYRPEDRRPPITPAARAARAPSLGFIAFALFAIIFFRLWYLQVLAGDQYLAEANDEPRARRAHRRRRAARSSTATARVIVDSRLANVVQIEPALAARRRARDARRGASASPRWLGTRRAGAQRPRTPCRALASRGAPR